MKGVAAALAAIAVTVCAFIAVKRKRAKGSPPVAAHGLPLLGHMLLIMKGPQVYLDFLFDGIDSDVVEANVLGFRMYYARGTENARRILTNTHLNKRFIPSNARVQLDLVDKGIVMNNHIESWKKNRKLLIESIARPRFIRGLAPKINKYLVPIFDLLDSISESNMPVMANVLFASISLDLTVDVLFSTNRGAAESYLIEVNGGERAKLDVYLQALQNGTEAASFFLRTPKLLYTYFPGYIAKAAKYKAAVAEWDQCVRELVKNKEADLEKDAEPDVEDLTTGIILNAKSQSTSWFEEALVVVKEAVTGGIDTTSNTLSFLTYELAKNPEVVEAIFEEVQVAVGASGKITHEIIGELKLLEASIQEATRLHTVIRFVQRQIDEDLELGEFTLTKNSVVFATSLLNHRSPDLWEDPLVFKPSRFIQRKNSDGPIGFGFAYTAFGYGARKCPGEALALSEMKLIMANLIRRYTFQLEDPNQILAMKDSLVLECRELSVFFRKR
ncbi:cytochrome P450 [Obelidium mucronatum]|nr:cytochrome P450 [Obelidium mucronatum]